MNGAYPELPDESIGQTSIGQLRLTNFNSPVAPSEFAEWDARRDARASCRPFRSFRSFASSWQPDSLGALRPASGLKATEYFALLPFSQAKPRWRVSPFRLSLSPLPDPETNRWPGHPRRIKLDPWSHAYRTGSLAACDSPNRRIPTVRDRATRCWARHNR